MGNLLANNNIYNLSDEFDWKSENPYSICVINIIRRGSRWIPKRGG